jgi:hypothetical protein
MKAFRPINVKTFGLPTTVLLLFLAAHAQTSRGAVSGTVVDPTGAVISRAPVSLTGIETGVRLKVRNPGRTTSRS